jgi:hypothetical protein
MQRKAPQRKEAQKDPKVQGDSKKPGMTKRRQARKVATMVKQLNKNPEDVEQQPLAEAGTGLTPEGRWDAQQQATVAAYAQSRGMQPREVLQALVNSMEKTLRKEKGENLASQTSSLGVKQREEAAGRTEARPNSGRGGRDLRERKADSNCVACCKDKKRGVPPKTRWKEEQKEKARSQEAQGKENRTVVTWARRSHCRDWFRGKRGSAGPGGSPEECRRPKERGYSGAGGMCGWGAQGTYQRWRAGTCNPSWERWQNSARNPGGDQPAVSQVKV